MFSDSKIKQREIALRLIFISKEFGFFRKKNGFSYYLLEFKQTISPFQGKLQPHYKIQKLYGQKQKKNYSLNHSHRVHFYADGIHCLNAATTNIHLLDYN